MLMRKCYDIYPCTRLALQVATIASAFPAPLSAPPSTSAIPTCTCLAV